MFQILKKYAPKIAPQAFAQMGFLDGKFATNALLSIKGAITAKSYNAAVRALKNQKTDILCKPFYVGNARRTTSRTTRTSSSTTRTGDVVVKESARTSQPVDKAIAQTRVWEKKFNLNGG